MATTHIDKPLRGKAIDLSHHLSDLARARVNSPLNKLFKYWEKPNLIIMVRLTSVEQCVRICPLNSLNLLRLQVGGHNYPSVY
jgi:hypothetical protein